MRQKIVSKMLEKQRAERHSALTYLGIPEVGSEVIGAVAELYGQYLMHTCYCMECWQKVASKEE